jgi:sugar phosphate isomerase/epimerase
MGILTKNPQVHIPYHLLRDFYLPLVLERRLNPEISFNHLILEEAQEQDYARTAEALQEAGVQITFHAPFLDLRPGALDPQIRKVTQERLRQVFRLVPLFRPVRVVCHPSFDAKYYPGTEDAWLEGSLETWGALADLAEKFDTTISLENVYEKDPVHLKNLFVALGSSHVRFCLDTGHFNVFSRTGLALWFEVLGEHLGQLHLHDNSGRQDEHLPLGEGNFPFAELASYLALLARDNLVVTLEAHSLSKMERAMQNYRLWREDAAWGKSPVRLVEKR